MYVVQYLARFSYSIRLNTSFSTMENTVTAPIVRNHEKAVPVFMIFMMPWSVSPQITSAPGKITNKGMYTKAQKHKDKIGMLASAKTFILLFHLEQE